MFIHVSDLLKDLSEQRVYHCIPVAPEGNAIRPSLNYGTRIPDEVCMALGISLTEKTPLVFAATRLSKSLAFGFNYRDHEILANGGIEGGGEFALVCNRDITMAKPRSVSLYAFLGEGFVRLPNADDQCVSPHSVPFSRTEKIFEAKNAEGLMHAGLQVFSVSETANEVYKQKLVENMLRSAGTVMGAIGEMMGSGRVVWENHDRDINCNPVLTARYQEAGVIARRSTATIAASHARPGGAE